MKPEGPSPLRADRRRLWADQWLTMFQVLPDASRGWKLSEAGLAGISASRLGTLGTAAQQ